MLVRLRLRRYRFTVCVCLIVLAALLYWVLSTLKDTSNHHHRYHHHHHQQQQQEKRGITGADHQLTLVSTNVSSSNHYPVSISALRLVRKYTTQATTDWFANSSVGQEHATDDDGHADTGMELEVEGKVAVKLMKPGDAEKHVRREVNRLHLRPPRSVQYSHGQWQIVDIGRQVYVYSAFYDARPDIDWPQVRVIAVAESDVQHYGLCCLLWYRSQRLPDVVEIRVTSVGPKILLRALTVLEQFIFSCRLDRHKTDPPTSVSIVAPHNFRLSNLLPVQVPRRPKQVIELGHCMSILYWKQDPFRLVEWLEAHRMWGVGEVNIYTTAIDNVTDSILRRYAETGFVKYRESPGPLGDDSEYSILLSMSPVINDCMYRNMYRYRYVVCTDVDEMIVPASPHHNYSQMLKAAAAEAAQDNAIVHSYLFRNTYFFVDFGVTNAEPWYLLSQRSYVMLSGVVSRL